MSDTSSTHVLKPRLLHSMTWQWWRRVGWIKQDPTRHHATVPARTPGPCGPTSGTASEQSSEVHGAQHQQAVSVAQVQWRSLQLKATFESILSYRVSRAESKRGVNFENPVSTSKNRPALLARGSVPLRGGRETLLNTLAFVVALAELALRS